MFSLDWQEILTGWRKYFFLQSVFRQQLDVSFYVLIKLSKLMENVF